MSKYNSKRITTADGVFDSKKEYKRWLYLKGLEEKGSIYNLQRQTEYVLIPAQYRELLDAKAKKLKKKCVERACKYKADFEYELSDGQIIVEDVKGYRGGGAYSVFVIKRKLMLEKYNIRVKEI